MAGYVGGFRLAVEEQVMSVEDEDRRRLRFAYPELAAEVVAGALQARPKRRRHRR